MNILVVGTGGREHAFVKALRSHKVFSFREDWEAEFISPQKDISSLVPRLREKEIELVVIGPEKELTLGWSDTLRKNGFLVFGPSQQAAQLEGSKIFAKEFMQEAQIPTARYQVVQSVSDVKKYSKKFSPPFVLKVDGLAGGKGVFICPDLKDLENKASKVFEEKIFGSGKALLEEHQKGYELSVFILTNGQDYRVLPLAQDYKRLLNDQQGPNTGGMGALAPISIDSELMKVIHQRILKPTVETLHKKNFEYRGVLYVGLMVTPLAPLVLEYNVRFGDPECQGILPLIQGDLGECLKQIALGSIPPLQFENKYSCCVVLSEKGYPENPQKGQELNLNSISTNKDLYVLYSGTRKENQKIIVNGGRVLNVLGLDIQKKEAIRKAHILAEKIKNQNPCLHFRTDIGKNSFTDCK